MSSPAARPTRARSELFEIFAISFAVILLEISYTRVFSFKFYYYFTYFIIGISLLGLGSGGVLLSIVSPRLRALETRRLVAHVSLAGAVALVLGYWVIAYVPVSTVQLTVRPLELVKLALVTLMLFLPFLAAGTAIAAILSARPERASRLYGADLLGAALGCAASVPVMTWLSPPSGVIVAAAALAIAALRATSGGLRGIAAGLAALFLTMAILPDSLPLVVTDPNKSISDHVRLPRSGIADVRRDGIWNGTWYSRWSPIFRIDVTGKADPGILFVHHDGQLGTAFYRAGAGMISDEQLRKNARRLPFSVLPPDPRVLIIGSAGGHEILASLHFGAREVVGVELNPVTVSLLKGPFADFTGRLHERENVRIVNAEGRSFLKRSDRQWDLIWLVAPDSYAAMNAASAGAYVLSESYLYTVEMIRESLAHLSPEGVICAQFGELDFERKPLRTSRYLATVREALDGSKGLNGSRRNDISGHVLVASGKDIGPFTLSTVLVKPTPFGDGDVRSFLRDVAHVKEGRPRHADGQVDSDGAVARVVSLGDRELDRWLDAYPYDISPVSDDSPFFWHFTRFRDIVASPIHRGVVRDWEDSIGERVLLTLLFLSVVFAGAALLLPFVLVRRIWREIPHKLPASAYFTALGVGFMLIEVSLIQMLTLFLGYPTYSLTVTLFSLLVFSGIGSLLSARYQGRRNRALAALTAVVVTLVLLAPPVLELLVDRLVGAPLAARIGLAVALIAPLGLCLGAFLPLGLTTVAAVTSHRREYVAWAWSVNGFFSVVSSVLAALLAMSFGFTAVLVAAAGIYVLGAAALLRVPQPAS